MQKLHNALRMLLIIHVCAGRMNQGGGHLNLDKMLNDSFATKDEDSEETEDDVCAKEDEKTGGSYWQTQLKSTASDAHGHCGMGFPCLDSLQCVPQKEICNGESYCDNGSDEWELECRDLNLERMWDNIFGIKEEDIEEITENVPCVHGTYPESCDCSVEIKTSVRDLPTPQSTLNASGEASTDPTATNRTPYESGEQKVVVVVGARVDCSARGMVVFPRNLPSNTISLDVSDNTITQLEKRDFKNLSQLRQLLLSRNKLKPIEERTFESLTDLETLKMIACDLEDLPPELFLSQKHLVNLDLSYNKLTTLRSSVFNLSSLGYLDIRGNQLSRIETGVFEDAPRIYFIHASQNKLTTIQADTFRPLRELRSLNVHRNDISNIERGAFSTNTKLIELNLGDNKLTEIKRGIFHNLTNAITLSLRNNSIRRVEQDAFTGMNKLQTLKLSKNPFTWLPIGIFDKLCSLKAIYFEYFSLCGYAPHVRLCDPKSDGISTFKNLLGNHLLRFAVWFVALLASLGNAFVLLARCFVNEDKKTHSFFIMNLAVADLLMGLYLLIIGIHDVIFRGAYILHDLTWRTSSVCKLSGFLSLLSSEVSIMTLTVITLDRFLSIVHPFRFKNRSLLHARLLMVFLWLLGIALASLPLLHAAYFGDFYYGGNGVCLPLQIDQPFADGWQFSLVVFVVFNLVAFTFISYAYLMMFITIRRSNLAMRSTKKNQDWALVKRFTLIVATDFVCWMPIIIVKFVALGGVSVSESVYAWFAIFVLPINSALNPILYTMTTALFKQKVLAPLGIVKTQRKKGYITGISVDETSTMSKNSGTRLSIISTKSRGGSVNGRFSSHKALSVKRT